MAAILTEPQLTIIKKINRYLETHVPRRTHYENRLLISGPSGSGKTKVTEEFLNPSHLNLPRHLLGKRCDISWSSLDDANVEVDLCNRLYPNRANFERALTDLGQNAIVIINDLEVAFRSIAHRRIAGKFLQEARIVRTRPLIVATSQIPLDSLPNDWFDVSLPLLGIPKLRDILRRPPVNDRHRYLILSEHESENWQQYLDCEISLLAVHLIEELMSRENAFDPLELIREKFPQPWRSHEVLHSTLYKTLAGQLREAEQDALARLLVWAAVDPGFDFWNDDVAERITHESLDQEGHVLQKYFFRIKPKIRLAHRSVLDLYGEDWPFERISKTQAHEDCRRWAAELCQNGGKVRAARLKVLLKRHELRSTRSREWSDLRSLDIENLGIPTSAVHEVAYALDDFLSAWNRPPKSMLESGESLIGRWFQPSTWDSGAEPADPLMRSTGEIILAELAYQALDKWDFSLDQSRRLARTKIDQDGDLSEDSYGPEWQQNAYSEEMASGQFDSDRYLDYRFLTTGLYGVMCYDGGNERDGVDTGRRKFKATQCMTWSKAFLDWYKGIASRDPLHEHYADSLTSNLIAAAIKAKPADQEPENFQPGVCDDAWNSVATEFKGWIDATNSDSVDRSLQLLTGSDTVRVDCDKKSRILDKLRYRLIYGRLLFFTKGAKRSADYLRERIINFRALTNSQEWFYAWVQYLNYESFQGREASIPDHWNVQELLESNEDNWAQYQLELANARQNWISTGMQNQGAERDRLIEQLGDKEIKFEAIDDLKASTACGFGRQILETASPDKRKPRIYPKYEGTQFLMEDAFYRICVEYACGVNRDVHQHHMDRWFSREVQAVPPIMPAMMILRGLPLAYEPRVVS